MFPSVPKLSVCLGAHILDYSPNFLLLGDGLQAV